MGLFTRTRATPWHADGGIVAGEHGVHTVTFRCHDNPGASITVTFRPVKTRGRFVIERHMQWLACNLDGSVWMEEAVDQPFLVGRSDREPMRFSVWREAVDDAFFSADDALDHAAEYAGSWDGTPW